jgi:hypothetical protein
MTAKAMSEAMASRARPRSAKERHPLYNVWTNMVRRCSDPGNRAFANYGGRGIRVCQEWAGDFEAFCRDLPPRPSPQHTIERINNDGGYEPGNVRWATRLEQARNQRSNVWITANGKTMLMRDWSRETGIPEPTLHRRLKANWTHERTVSERPMRSSAQRLTHEDVAKIREMLSSGARLAAIGSAFGVSKSAVFSIKSASTWREL